MGLLLDLAVVVLALAVSTPLALLAWTVGAGGVASLGARHALAELADRMAPQRPSIPEEAGGV